MASKNGIPFISKLGIKSKFVILVIALILISVRFVGSSSFQTARKGIDRITDTLLNHQADMVVSRVLDTNEQEFLLLRGLALDDTLRNPDVAPLDKYFFLQQFRDIDRTKYQGMGFVQPGGMCVVAPGIEMDFSFSDYYQASSKGKEFVSNPIVNDMVDLEEGTANSLRFYSVPVYDYNNKFCGVLDSILVGNSLNTVSEAIDIGEGYHPVIIDMTSGEVLGNANPLESFDPEAAKSNPAFSEMWNSLLNGGSGAGRYKTPAGKEMVYAYRPIGGGTNWTVLCAAPISAYNAELNLISRSLISGSILAVIIALIVGLISIRLLVLPLKNIRLAIDDIATGNADLTNRIPHKTNDEIGKVVQGFNTFIEKLQVIISGLKDSKDTITSVGKELEATTRETSDSINEIIANIGGVSNQISAQTMSVNETAGAVNEIASNIESLERMIENQSNGILQASSAVEQMMGNINSVNTSVDRMAESFVSLSASASSGAEKQMNATELMQQIKDQSETLQEANSAIAAIAEQTNLLAMNAAIEAAHAGDAGKGFSVVADEIRKLSETSTEQSRTIGDQLNAIQQSIENVFHASNESNAAFQTVNDKISETDQIVRQIKSAMEEQAEGSKQIGEALHLMNDSTAEVRVASREMSEGNKQILSEIQKLQNTTLSMNSSMEEMASGAQVITNTGAALSAISDKVNATITEIGNQVDQFKV